MFDLRCMIQRNISKFLRDKAAVFFSLLSVLILLALYFLFIGRYYTSGDELDFLTAEQKTFLSVGVIMGGVLVINTVSLSLGVMGNLIYDLDQRKLDGFLVTPVKRYKIILSYYISSIMVTAVLTLLMWTLTILYVGIVSEYWYSLMTIIKASGLIVFFTFLSATLMIFLTTLLKSINAFGALSGVLGTLIGFISGIYMPLFVLGNAMANVASIVPFTHMTILLKQVILKDAYEVVGPEVESAVETHFGTVEIGIFGQEIHMIWIMILTLALGSILLVFSYRRMNQKMGKA